MLKPSNAFNKWPHKFKSTRFVLRFLRINKPRVYSLCDFTSEYLSFIYCLQPGPEVYPKLQDLPEECIREIMLRINDHRDLESSSAAWSLMAALASEQRMWRELTQFHFTQHQIDQMIQKHFSIRNNNNNNNNHNTDNNTNNNNNNNITPNNSNNQNNINADNSSNETGSNQRSPSTATAVDGDDDANVIDEATKKRRSRRAMNANDWQTIYHALRR